MSATEMPAISGMHGVLVDALRGGHGIDWPVVQSGLTVIAIRSVSMAVPSLVATVSVSPPLKFGLPV